MDEQALRRALKELAEEGFPKPAGLWPRIRTQLEPSPRPLRLRRWLRQPLAWGLAALLLALAIGVGAYAGGLWERFALSQRPFRASLVTPLGLRQERDGYVITLEWAYADWNSILIGYRIQGAPELQALLVIPEVRLQDEAGRVFSLEAQEGLVDASEAIGLRLPPSERVFVVAFDAWGHAELPSALSLQLTLQLETLDPQSEERPSGDPGKIEPFVFSFTVPVHPGYALRTPRAATANEITITLERLIAAPSGTKARLCIVSLDPWQSWSMILMLALDSRAVFAGGITRDGAGCFRTFFPVGSTDPRLPEGSLQVLELIGWDPVGGMEPIRLPGPWRFPLTPEP
ncbi:hypothetical protein [Thermoflexus sp.]|uniref:hypothetical protein n=1 Tax=Thermoflexus sp. TaxID=1969742 RepID=UPI002ADDFF34|nr:hypothetical protein [Thermoflexus sp.]